MMQLLFNTRFLTLLGALLACLGWTPAFSHGLMLDPMCRAFGTPNEDYQYCFGNPGCECGEFPDPGPIVATYQTGQAIEVTIDVTLVHDSNAIFRFQLCPPDELSPECFAAGEFATEDFDRTVGLHTYQISLPPKLECDPCVLRWKWDYGFLSCADVRIVSGETSIGPLPTWTALKASYR